MGRTIAIATVLACAGSARADDGDKLRKLPVSVEVDALPFAFRGATGWLAIAPAPHWELRLGFEVGEPPNLVGTSGFTTRIRISEAVRAHYYLRDDNRGLNFALMLARFDWQFTRSDVPGAEGEQDQLQVWPMIAYTWYPTSSGFYIQPLVGVGIAFYTIGPDVMIGTQTFHWKSPFYPGGFLQLGYNFGK